jgi:hypothetical protein
VLQVLLNLCYERSGFVLKGMFFIAVILLNASLGTRAYADEPRVTEVKNLSGGNSAGIEDTIMVSVSNLETLLTKTCTEQGDDCPSISLYINGIRMKGIVGDPSITAGETDGTLRFDLKRLNTDDSTDNDEI